MKKPPWGQEPRGGRERGFAGVPAPERLGDPVGVGVLEGEDPSERGDEVRRRQRVGGQGRRGGFAAVRRHRDHEPRLAQVGLVPDRPGRFDGSGVCITRHHVREPPQRRDLGGRGQHEGVLVVLHTVEQLECTPRFAGADRELGVEHVRDPRVGSQFPQLGRRALRAVEVAQAQA